MTSLFILRPIAGLANTLILGRIAELRCLDAARCYRRISTFVSLSVCLFVTVVSPAKTAERIKIPFGMWTRVGPRNYNALDGVYILCNLVNATEPSLYGGDAAFCEMTLTTYLQVSMLLSSLI